jgi:hypothetical protein
VHIVIGTRQYAPSTLVIERLRSEVYAAADSGRPALLQFQDAEGDDVVVIWTPGVFFAVQYWEIPDFSV